MRVRRLPILFPATPRRSRTQPHKVKPLKLSVREEQILVLICEGWTWREIADMMGKSPHTIVELKRRIREKTGARRVARMVIWAVAHNLVDPRKMLSS